MEEIKIKAEVRAEKGTKKTLSEYRRKRLIPAVVYGGKNGSVSVAVDEKTLMASLKAAGANAIITLEHGSATDTVILKELQRDVVTGQPIHADFQRVSMTDKIEVEVPLHLIGEPPGVKLQGGVLDHALRALEVRCLPNKIPNHIDVDVSSLNMGESISVAQLNVPADVEVMTDPETLVAHVLHVRVEEEKPAEGEAAKAEPEVIAAKGKAEEEGAAGAGAEGAKKEGAKKEGGK